MYIYLSQTWGQLFMCKALIPFSGKWRIESKHSTQFATGLVTIGHFYDFSPSAKSKYLHPLPPSLFLCHLEVALSLPGLWVCLDYFSLCFILDSFCCCAFEFTNFISAVPDLPFIPSTVFFISLAAFHLRIQFGSLFFQFY